MEDTTEVEDIMEEAVIMVGVMVGTMAAVTDGDMAVMVGMVGGVEVVSMVGVIIPTTMTHITIHRIILTHIITLMDTIMGITIASQEFLSILTKQHLAPSGFFYKKKYRMGIVL